MLVAAILLCAGILCVGGAPTSDEVTSLPGLQQQPPWKHYSGYLKASAGKHLHYWFVESANNPKTDPLVLWMNGGPGCSSDLGLLTEHGPFRISKDGSGVTYNKYSWNTAANMIYLEAPAGVGFSYADDKNYTTDDNQVAYNNHLALKDFFTKFPEFSGNDFFITGESYGGIYVPTLSTLVVDDSTINFKGMAIGNGISNFDTNDDSLLYFGYYHGLFGDDQWSSLLKACCPGAPVKRCQFVKKYTDYDGDECSDMVGKLLGIIYNQGLNEYNLYASCAVPKVNEYVYTNNSFTVNLPSFGHRKHPYMQQKNNKLKFLQQARESVRVSPPCLDYEYVVSYLRTGQVMNALHISPFAPQWDVCSGAVGGNYVTLYQDVSSLYKKVLAAGKKVLVYNGDIDMACNFLGDEWFVEALNLPVVAERTAWHVKDASGTPQVAGFVKQFKQLSLTTVKGAGHMVPQDKPVAALEMFNNFIHA